MLFNGHRRRKKEKDQLTAPRHANPVMSCFALSLSPRSIEFSFLVFPLFNFNIIIHYINFIAMSSIKVWFGHCNNRQNPVLSNSFSKRTETNGGTLNRVPIQMEIIIITKKTCIGIEILSVMSTQFFLSVEPLTTNIIMFNGSGFFSFLQQQQRVRACVRVPSFSAGRKDHPS